MPARSVVSAQVAFATIAFLSGCASSDIVSNSTVVLPAVTQPATPLDRSFIWSRETGTQEIPMPSSALGMYVTDINDDGVVTGSIMMRDFNNNTHAFIWSQAGGFTDLGTLAGPLRASIGSFINNAGVVLGSTEGPNSPTNGPMGPVYDYTFMWTPDGGMKAIEPGEGIKSIARIQADGTLIGGTAGGGFYWKSAAATKTISPPSGANCSAVADVNDNGDVLGYFGNMAAGWCTFMVAVIATSDGKMTTIDECAVKRQEVCRTEVHGLSSAGEVTGVRNGRVFRWTTVAGFMEFPADGAGIAINNSGDIAGTESMDEMSWPITWSASGKFSEIPLPNRSRSGYSVGINVKGQVVGNFR